MRPGTMGMNPYRSRASEWVAECWAVQVNNTWSREMETQVTGICNVHVHEQVRRIFIININQDIKYRYTVYNFFIQIYE